MYDIHPFLRPFDIQLNIEKPYDATGPFENGADVRFHWRIADIMNAMIGSCLRIEQVEELFAEKDYDNPFWIPMSEKLKGVTATREEIDKMYDWQHNPKAALPNWLNIVARKGL